MSEQVPRRDIEAVLETRRELGAEMEPAVVDSFADRVEAAIQSRVSAELKARKRDQEVQKVDANRQMVLGIVTAGVAIPLTAISLAVSGLPAMLVVWIGLVAINMAYALRKGRRAD